MKRVLACAVVGVLCAFTGSATASTFFQPGAPGIGDPYFPLDGNGGYDVGHYSLDVTYDPATDSPRRRRDDRGDRRRENLSSFNLDFHGLNVRVHHRRLVERRPGRRDGDELTVDAEARTARAAARSPSSCATTASPGSSMPRLGPGGVSPDRRRRRDHRRARRRRRRGSRSTTTRPTRPRTRSRSPSRTVSRRSPTATCSARRRSTAGRRSCGR